MNHEHNHSHSHDSNHSCGCTCSNPHHDHGGHAEQAKTHEHSHDHGACCSSESSPDSADDPDLKLKYKVVGLDCANCALKVESALNKHDGVEKASINFANGTLRVKPKDGVNVNTLISQLNVVADKVEPGVKFVSEEKADVEHDDSKIELIKIIISTVLLLIAVYLEDKVSFPPIFLFLIPYFIVGFDVLKTSVRNILKGEIFDENFLMAIATIGAFVVGHSEEAVAVMLFYSLGEYFQSLAVAKSRRSISELMDIKSDFANLIVDGKEKKVDPKELKINDIISVRVGEKVPVDGIIIDGSTSLDVSALSGESALKDVHKQDDVLAGSINKSGVFTMKVTHTYDDSTVAKILELVENAASKKSPIENFITKFAKVYTPIVVFLAVAITIIPTLIFGFDEFYTWLYRGCTFLVISCPCALVVSVPLGVFAGIGSASRIGVLVKGGNFLELLGSVNTVVMDKTGTITKGTFNVVEVSSDEVLEYAAYAESKSNHPIAKSIVKSYAKEIDDKRISNYEELAGFGIKTLLDSKVLLAGNAKLMQEEHIEFNEHDNLGSIIYVAYDNKYLGYIVIGDEIKEHSATAIQELKELGVRDTVMLTGDRTSVAKDVASKVHIDSIHAELLPQNKVEVLESYLANKAHTVAFVGDGINDAPALVRADIGVSMGGVGSDVAIEASDIVLMTDDLLLLPKAMKISRYTKKIVMQNIVFSLGVKLIVLILSAFGIANMWMGVFADVGVTLIAILNSMRVLQYHKKL